MFGFTRARARGRRGCDKMLVVYVNILQFTKQVTLVEGKLNCIIAPSDFKQMLDCCEKILR